LAPGQARKKLLRRMSDPFLAERKKPITEDTASKNDTNELVEDTDEADDKTFNEAGEEIR
jgi:hypothetical protein